MYSYSVAGAKSSALSLTIGEDSSQSLSTTGSVSGRLAYAAITGVYDKEFSWGQGEARSLSTGKSSEESYGFTIGDADLGDYFDILVGRDPVYGTPVFKTIGGQSSCPREQGTHHRDRFNTQFVMENQFEDAVDLGEKTATIAVDFDKENKKCASVYIEITKEYSSDYMAPYVLAVHSVEDGLAGILTKFDGNPFHGAVEVPFYQKGLKKRKHRIDFCPSEDGNDVDIDGVYGPIQLVVFSECEWLMQMNNDLSIIHQTDEDPDEEKCFGGNKNQCSDKVFDYENIKLVSNAPLQNRVEIQCLSFKKSQANGGCGENTRRQLIIEGELIGTSGIIYFSNTRFQNGRRLSTGGGGRKERAQNSNIKRFGAMSSVSTLLHVGSQIQKIGAKQLGQVVFIYGHGNSVSGSSSGFTPDELAERKPFMKAINKLFRDAEMPEPKWLDIKALADNKKVDVNSQESYENTYLNTMSALEEYKPDTIFLTACHSGCGNAVANNPINHAVLEYGEGRLNKNEEDRRRLTDSSNKPKVLQLYL